MSIVAIIPAWNEPAIGLTVDSIYRQTHKVSQVIVVANNCTDGGETVRIAKEHGALVMDLPSVKGKKAGALNIGFLAAQQQFTDMEYVLQMDADTILDERFVENTISSMEANDRIAALGASFIAQNKPGEGVVGKFLVLAQQQEFARFHGGQLTRQTSVLSGTASLFRVNALEQLRQQRGFIWSETSIVEDYELTKALQEAGWLCMTDASFIAHTDVMTNWSDLLHQRKRWQRGTLEVIFRQYRGKESVRIDKMRQVFAHAMIVPHLLSYCLLVVGAVVWQGLNPWPLLAAWALLGAYNSWASRHAGWRASLFAGLVFTLELYNFVRYVWLFQSWRLYRAAQDQAW